MCNRLWLSCYILVEKINEVWQKQLKAGLIVFRLNRIAFLCYQVFNGFDHSHKKRKDSLETRAILIEISMLYWNLSSGSKHRDHFKKTWLSLKGISYLQVIFVLIWMKQTLIWFNLQRDGTGNGFSNIKDAFVGSLQLQTSVLHQSMCIFKANLSKFIW